MPLEVHPAGTEDAARAAELERLAYSTNRFLPVLFPGPFPAGTEDGRAADLARELTEDPMTKWFKVLDTELSGEKMIAFAKWQIQLEPQPKQSHRQFPPGANQDACRAVFGGLAEQRESILNHRPCIYLSMLVTDPQHQRRGAGQLLMRWGLDEAERLGVICYLDSSPEAHALYLKCGFKDIAVHSVDMRPWNCEADHQTWSMIRDLPPRA